MIASSTPFSFISSCETTERTWRGKSKDGVSLNRRVWGDRVGRESRQHDREEKIYHCELTSRSQQTTGRNQKSERVWKERDAAGGVGVQTDRDKGHVFGGDDKVQRKARFDVLFTKKGSSRLPFDTHVCAPTDLTPTGLKRTASM